MNKKYDVIIFGGGTAGCACAWNCGRLGLKTLLLEKSSCLGGSMTNSLVVPIMKSGDNQINTDFYEALTKEMKSCGAQVTYQDNKGWFNPEILKIVLDKMLHEVNIDIIFNYTLSPCNELIYTNNNLNCKINILSEYIETKYIVDATGDLEFCKKIGCEFLPKPKEFQPASLRFIMSGIDRRAFGQWLLSVDKDREVTTVEEIDGQIHLSTAYTWDTNKKWALKPYFDAAVEKGILKDTDRNYFQVFSVAGTLDSIAFNCPRIVENIDPMCEKDKSRALIQGRASILRIANFCKKYFPGFEKAYISNISNSLGVRASRQIKGKYIYTIEDLRLGKKFEHPALISNYPVDVHSKDKNASTLENTGEYQLPIESLMSADYDNLFVAGRGLSADNMAQGALRVQASCFSMGEAVAKYISASV